MASRSVVKGIYELIVALNYELIFESFMIIQMSYKMLSLMNEL